MMLMLLSTECILIKLFFSICVFVFFHALSDMIITRKKGIKLTPILTPKLTPIAWICGIKRGKKWKQ